VLKNERDLPRHSLASLVSLVLLVTLLLVLLQPMD
jgi:hypothetical protein